MPLSANTSLSFTKPARMFSGPAITRVQASVFRNVSPHEGRQRINHGAHDDVDFFLEAEDQFAVVAAHGLHRIAAVHRAAAFSEFAALLLGSVRAEHDVFGGDPDFAQKRDPELVGAPHVQDLGNPDADSASGP